MLRTHPEELLRGEKNFSHSLDGLYHVQCRVVVLQNRGRIDGLSVEIRGSNAVVIASSGIRFRQRKAFLWR